MSDRLQKFRDAARVRLKMESVQGEPYQAFEAATVPQRRFNVRPVGKPDRVLSYGYLFDIRHAGGVIVGLSFSMPNLTIEIEGRDLEGMVDALREERLTHIVEHLPAWHEPAAEGMPYIQALRIFEAGKPQDDEDPVTNVKPRH